jgi:short-subunit dehydrogenase
LDWGYSYWNIEAIMQDGKKKEFAKRYGPWGVIAGASEGLGAAYAESLAARGLNVFLIARRMELLQPLAARLAHAYPIQVQTMSRDLSRQETFGDIVKASEDIEVGLLVCNAGHSEEGPFLDHPLEAHLEEVSTNVLMPLRLVHHFGMRMRAAGHGGIVLMTSLSAFQGSAYISNYSATKAYNLVLAEGLWEEWRAAGVDVLACIAGAVRTPNYLSSTPRSAGKLADATIEPETVVRATLNALGRGPTVIPGRMNRFSSFVMRRVLSRRGAIRMMGSVLRKMYAGGATEPKGDE